MYPVLFKIGPFALYSLWAGVLIGFFVATVLFLKRAKYERMDLNFILGHGLSLLIGSFLFSRSCFFFANWGYFGQFSIINFLKQLLFFWQPGYSFWGAILGFSFVFYWHCRRHGESFLQWLDVALVPILIACANFGQLLDGEGYGRETILPWGITFENTGVKYTVPVHPTQVYSLLLIATVIFTRKIVMDRWSMLSKNYNWTIFAIAGFSLGRFILEFFRGDDTLEFLGIRVAFFIAMIVFVPTAYLLYKQSKQTLIN